MIDINFVLTINTYPHVIACLLKCIVIKYYLLTLDFKFLTQKFNYQIYL